MGDVPADLVCVGCGARVAEASAIGSGHYGGPDDHCGPLVDVAGLYDHYRQARSAADDLAAELAELRERVLEAASKPRTCLHCRHFQMAPECKTWGAEPEDFRYGRCIARLGYDVEIDAGRADHVEEVTIMRTSFGCGAFEEKGGDDE